MAAGQAMLTAAATANYVLDYMTTCATRHMQLSKAPVGNAYACAERGEPGYRAVLIATKHHDK